MLVKRRKEEIEPPYLILGVLALNPGSTGAG
jgi:hypothetical protein